MPRDGGICARYDDGGHWYSSWRYWSTAELRLQLCAHVLPAHSHQARALKVRILLGMLVYAQQAMKLDFVGANDEMHIGASVGRTIVSFRVCEVNSFVVFDHFFFFL